MYQRRTLRTLFSVIWIGPALLSLIAMFTSIFLILCTIKHNSRRTSRVSQHNIQNTNRTISNQAIIYGIFFFNTYVWLLFNPILDLSLPEEKVGTFQLFCRFLGDIFYGWKGFFNFFIYVRPRFIRIHSYRDDMSHLGGHLKRP